MGDGDSGDSDYEDKGNGKRTQKATKADGDENDTDIEEVKGVMCWAKSRASPHRSDTVNPTPCKRCQRASTECYQQESGRGRGACYRCGKLKVKCSLKDASERPVQVTNLKPMPKQNPPMRPNPEPMMKPRPTKRSTKRKAPTAIVITDAESEDGMVPPPRTRRCLTEVSGPSASATQEGNRADSPRRFTAVKKGKGKGKAFRHSLPSA